MRFNQSNQHPLVKQQQQQQNQQKRQHYKRNFAMGNSQASAAGKATTTPDETSTGGGGIAVLGGGGGGGGGGVGFNEFGTKSRRSSRIFGRFGPKKSITTPSKEATITATTPTTTTIPIIHHDVSDVTSLQQSHSAVIQQLEAEQFDFRKFSLL